MLILFPLLTFPYISKVLQVENIGKINYSQSIVSYFSLIASLGITSYAIREGSRIKNNNVKLNKFVNEIFSINIYSTLLAYSLLFIAIFFIGKFREYWLLMLIQSFSIIFTTISVDWINVIFEDYFYITIRSIIIQIFSLILMYVFVKNPCDYYLYEIISVCCNGLVSVLNLMRVKKYCKIKLCKRIDFKRHIRPILILFYNNLAVSIYVSSDTTMLGWMVGAYYVGLYAVAVKIYSIIKQLIGSIYSVITARMSLYYAEGKTNEFKTLLSSVINIIIFISIPATFGILFTANEIVIELSDTTYEPSSVALRILALAFFFAILGGVLASCVNLPLKREKNNLLATVISAMLNIILNLFLIPKYKQNGAAFTTFLAELSVSLILLYGLRDHYDLFNFKEMKVNITKCLISSSPMFLTDYISRYLLHLKGIKYLSIMVILSASTYFGMNVLLKNQCIILSIKEIFKTKKTGGINESA